MDTQDPVANAVRELAEAELGDHERVRSRLLARGRAIGPRLEELSESAPSATERALAAALLTRISRPTDAKKIDAFALPTWSPSPRNPAPRIHRALAAAYEPFPELAFEKLHRARGGQADLPPSWSDPRLALLEVVAKGPDGFARLAELADMYPPSLPLLVTLDRERGSCQVLKWLESHPSPLDDPTRREALSVLDTDDPLALYRLRQALRDGANETRTVAAWGLAGQRDGAAAPWLLSAIAAGHAMPDALEALQQMLTPAEASKLVGQMSLECRAAYRRGAAAILEGSEDPGSLELLVRLAGDPDSGVRRQALSSIETLAIRFSGSGIVLDDRVEAVVLRSMSASDVATRRLAGEVSWRLVVEEHRSPSDALRAAFAKAVVDPDDTVRIGAVHRFAVVFSAADADLILVLLGDLNQLPEWDSILIDRLSQARKSVGTPSSEALRELERRVPGIAPLIRAWRER